MCAQERFGQTMLASSADAEKSTGLERTCIKNTNIMVKTYIYVQYYISANVFYKLYTRQTYKSIGTKINLTNSKENIDMYR